MTFKIMGRWLMQPSIRQIILYIARYSRDLSTSELIRNSLKLQRNLYACMMTFETPFNDPEKKAEVQRLFKKIWDSAPVIEKEFFLERFFKHLNKKKTKRSKTYANKII